MRSGYQIRDQNAIHFVSFVVVNWIDLFTRDLYRNVLIDSLKYCQQTKGLKIHTWVIVTNHVHFILSAKEGYKRSNILRDLNPTCLINIVNFRLGKLG